MLLGSAAVPLVAAFLLSGCVSANDPALVSTSGFAPGAPDVASLQTVSADPSAVPVPTASPTGPEMAAAADTVPGDAAADGTGAVNALAQGITQTAPAQAVNNLYAAPGTQQTAQALVAEAPAAPPSPERFGDKPTAAQIAAASADAANTARAENTTATLVTQASAPAETVAAQPAVQLAAVAPAPKKASLFSRLFTAQPTPPKSVPRAKQPRAERASVEIQPRSAGSDRLPGVNTSASKLFGIGDGTGEDDENGLIEVASAAGLARLAPNGLRTQTDRVDVACLKPKLVRVLRSIEGYYGRPVVVTSGYRSPNYNRRVGGASGSKHTTCEAADIQVDGVSKWQLAKYLRSRPDRGGVGTYCHTESVHIDVGSARDWNWRCRRRK